MTAEAEYKKMAIIGLVEQATYLINDLLTDNPEWNFAEAFDAWSELYVMDDEYRYSLAEGITSYHFGHSWTWPTLNGVDNENHLAGYVFCCFIEKTLDKLSTQLCKGSNEIYDAILAARVHENDESLKV